MSIEKAPQATALQRSAMFKKCPQFSRVLPKNQLSESGLLGFRKYQFCKELDIVSFTHSSEFRD